jgi:hypothetical protein
MNGMYKFLSNFFHKVCVPNPRRLNTLSSRIPHGFKFCNLEVDKLTVLCYNYGNGFPKVSANLRGLI